jgi:hypothetical protein
MEKEELEKLVKVIKNKKKIENKTKEINYSTSKKRSNFKSQLKKTHIGKHSIDVQRKKKEPKRKNKKQTKGLENSLGQKRSRRDESREDTIYDFLKIEQKASNKLLFDSLINQKIRK